MHRNYAELKSNNKILDKISLLIGEFIPGVSNSKLYTGRIEKENVSAGRRLK